MGSGLAKVTQLIISGGAGIKPQVYKTLKSVVVPAYRAVVKYAFFWSLALPENTKGSSVSKGGFNLSL